MYFTIIPQHIGKQKKLGEARFLYGMILTLSSKNGYCYASNKYLAHAMECDSRSITRYIKLLQSFNYIKIDKTISNSRVIIPIDTFVGQRLQTNTITPREIDPEVEELLDDIWQKIKISSTSQSKTKQQQQPKIIDKTLLNPKKHAKNNKTTVSAAS
jgi:hypothetical protein